MRIVTPTSDTELESNVIKRFDNCSIFLAGTIDNGDSKNWQAEVIYGLIKEYAKYDLTIYNPRRDRWNKIASEEELMYQINWEQDKLNQSNIIVMVLLDDSKSPVSLMELGEFCQSEKLVVFCTESFYRYANVLNLCNRCWIPFHNTTDTSEIIEQLKEILNSI